MGKGKGIGDLATSRDAPPSVQDGGRRSSAGPWISAAGLQGGPPGADPVQDEAGADGAALAGQGLHHRPLEVLVVLAGKPVIAGRREKDVERQVRRSGPPIAPLESRGAMPGPKMGDALHSGNAPGPRRQTTSASRTRGGLHNGTRSRHTLRISSRFSLTGWGSRGMAIHPWPEVLCNKNTSGYLFQHPYGPLTALIDLSSLCSTRGYLGDERLSRRIVKNLIRIDQGKTYLSQRIPPEEEEW